MSDRSKSSNPGGERYLSRLDVIRSCGCPECHAPLGRPCTRRNGGERSQQHRSRYNLAELLNA